MSIGSCIDEASMYYITGRYDMAYEFYNRAVHQKPSEVQVLLRLHLNLAACGLKLKIFERVLEHCNAALLLDVNNSKALLRRAMSYEGLGLYEQGIADAELVLKYEIHTSLRNPAFHILNRLNSLRQQDNVAKTKDIRPGSFITSAQTIRLCFSSPHIPIINGNNSHEFRFFLSNELGLWSRDFINDSDIHSQENIICSCRVWKCYTTKTPWIAFNNEYAEVNTIEADICVANVIGGTIGENGRATLQLQSKCSESLLAKNLTVIALITFHFTCFSGVDIIPAISMPTCIVFTNENINLSEREVHELVSSISYMRDSLQIGAEVYPQCIREVRLKDGDLGSAYVFECPGYVSIGGKIWDATYALLDYIQDHPELISGKRVVELGCGTGALGMSIASLPRKPASITLTDTAELMPLVSANLKLNRLFQEHTNLNCKECQYNWGDDGPVVHDELLPCDVIIAADVVYDSDFFNDLLQAIHDLLETPQSTCISSRVEEISDLSDTPTTASSHERIMILAYRKRNDDEHRFFDLLHSQSSLQVTELQAGLAMADCIKLKDVNLLKIIKVSS